MKINIILLLLCLTAFASASLDKEFEAFKTKYGKVYKDQDEHNIRFKIYQDNVRYISLMQSHRPTGANVGINKFADLSAEEYQNMLKVEKRPNTNRKSSHHGAYMVRIPTSVDWRTKGVVGPVTDQGDFDCPSGFAVTNAVASAYAITADSSEYQGLSTTQVCNCTDNENQDPEEYIVATGVYFDAGYKNNCPKDKITDDTAVCVGSYDFVTSGSEEDLAVAVTSQPVAVAIDASQTSFQFYTNGVYYDADCSNTTLDHDLLIVGYGTSSSSGDYWIAQNTWGSDWGMEGYIWLARNKNNACGVATYASYPTDTDLC